MRNRKGMECGRKVSNKDYFPNKERKEKKRWHDDGANTRTSWEREGQQKHSSPSEELRDEWRLAIGLVVPFFVSSRKTFKAIGGLSWFCLR